MNSNPKKILLLGAGFTTRNMGVWALTSGAVALALHVFPDARVYLFDYHFEPATYNVKHPGGAAPVQLINIRFSKKFWLSNNIARLIFTALILKLVPRKALRERLIAENFWLNHIRTADVIGSIAGGDSFSDIYGLRRLIYVCLPQILVLILGKPLVLLPQTIGPFKSIFGRTIGRYILWRAEKIYSRDRSGLVAVRELCSGGQKKAEFGYDMGFALQPHIAKDRVPPWLAERGGRTPIVGLNVSGLLYIGGYRRNNMFGLKVDYKKLIHALISCLVQVENADVVLVPHVLGSAGNEESDSAASRDIFNNTESGLRERLRLVDGEFNHHEIKAIIGYCDFFIGSRMHACIAALSQCIPAAGLAYSGKFRGVFETIGMNDLIVDLRENDVQTAIEKISQAFQRRSEFRALIDAVLPEVRLSQIGLFSSMDNSA